MAVILLLYVVEERIDDMALTLYGYLVFTIDSEYDEVQ